MARHGYNKENIFLEPTSEEQSDTAEIESAVRELSQSVSTLNRALIALQQKLAGKNQSNHRDIIEIPRTVH
ncbi:hypothetical protein [Teredinibacter haidensis]|uniref:hypothetical protein n=1 Tax=Teredinibacter haidensis TaxID=2731755 RepID=UPI000948FE5B|nr:hypothetical protein [Teredinibacter haidensis]